LGKIILAPKLIFFDIIQTTHTQHPRRMMHEYSQSLFQLIDTEERLANNSKLLKTDPIIVFEKVFPTWIEREPSLFVIASRTGEEVCVKARYSGLMSTVSNILRQLDIKTSCFITAFENYDKSFKVIMQRFCKADQCIFTITPHVTKMTNIFGWETGEKRISCFVSFEKTALPEPTPAPTPAKAPTLNETFLNHTMDEQLHKMGFQYYEYIWPEYGHTLILCGVGDTILDPNDLKVFKTLGFENIKTFYGPFDSSKETNYKLWPITEIV